MSESMTVEIGGDDGGAVPGPTERLARRERAPIDRHRQDEDQGPQITVDVNILSMLKQAASCLSEMASENVYFAAIGPDMELTIIVEEDAPSILSCFDEDDALISVKGAPLFISYNPAQVLKLAGKRYLTGPVIFYRTDGHSTIVSLTVEDIYRFQTYLESHSTTLMADGQKLTCICID